MSEPSGLVGTIGIRLLEGPRHLVIVAEEEYKRTLV